MHSIVKKLIRNSTILRNSITLSYCSTTTSYANSSIENLANYKLAVNDEKNAMQIMSPYSENCLHIYFRDIEQNCDKMNLDDAVYYFKELHKIIMRKKHLRNIQFTKYKGFEEMCKVILKNAQFLKIYEVVKLIDTLETLNIPYSSMVFRTLFQLVLANLNALNLKEIMKIYKILIDSQFELPFGHILIKGLRYAFEQQSIIELHSKNDLLAAALSFSNAINCRSMTNYITKIIFENPASVTMDNVRHIFLSLNSNERNFKHLLSVIRRFIRVNVRTMKEQHIEHIVFYICKQEVGLFNEEIDILIKRLVNSEGTLSGKLLILKHLNRMQFSSTSLLDSISFEILDNQHCLKNKRVEFINELIKALVISDYKPHGWKTIVQVLENYLSTMPQTLHIYLINNIFQLLSLDHYSPKLLEMVFHSCNNSMKILPTNLFLRKIYKLHWCVKLLYPEYEGEMLTEEIMRQTVEDQINITVLKRPFLQLKESIIEVVNGDTYIMSKLKSKVIRTVDFVVAIRPDGSFVDLKDQNVTFVEELQSIPDCNKILIYGFPTFAYSSNRRKLFSTVKIQLKALETYPGFHTIVIDPFTWVNLSANDKVEHIRQVINAKCCNI